MYDNAPLTEEEANVYRIYFKDNPTRGKWALDNFSPKLLRYFFVDSVFGKYLTTTLPLQLSWRSEDRDYKGALGNCGIGNFCVRYMKKDDLDLAILHCAILHKAYVLITTASDEELLENTKQSTLEEYGFKVLVPWTLNPSSGRKIQLYMYTIPN